MTAKSKRNLAAAVKFIVLGGFLVLVMFPFVWMLLTSLKGSQGEIYAFPVKYLPNPVSFVNYVEMLWKGSFAKYMLNSLICSSVAALCSVFIAILASYVISRFRFRLKGALLLFFLITQMIPMFIMLAPLYQMLAKAKMLNNLWGLAFLYTNMMIPFSVVTLCGFFDNVPKSLEEAAWIDGCGYLSALFRVAVPVIKPGIAASIIFAFINSWNELFMAVMFIDVDKFKTIPVGLNGLILKYDIKWGEMAAGTIMSLIPTMCLFAFAQKYMIEGLTAGAVKG
ncbi:carbohydrate ABC transporter permease [Clostridiaceae bacterium]|nr:carbohydrate ABC transporter permease [Clostridiaceae bacterium]RKI15588.1 carbohydrate ABC transporter permease [bacterium 1XD21-70]